MPLQKRSHHLGYAPHRPGCVCGLPGRRQKKKLINAWSRCWPPRWSKKPDPTRGTVAGSTTRPSHPLSRCAAVGRYEQRSRTVEALATAVQGAEAALIAYCVMDGDHILVHVSTLIIIELIIWMNLFCYDWWWLFDMLMSWWHIWQSTIPLCFFIWPLSFNATV